MPDRARLRLGVLASGSGTNLQAILDATRERRLDADTVVVVSNVAGAGALERARAAGVATEVIDHRGFSAREQFDARVVEALRRHRVEWVVLAGFMRLVTAVLLDAFRWRVINVHPALLPAFPGAHAQRQAVDYGAKISGCTVHFVDEGTDTGPVIAQAAVPVLDDDDEATLRARILVEEHRLLPQVLQAIAEGRVRLEDENDTGGHGGAGSVRRRPRVWVARGAPAIEGARHGN